MNLKYLLVAFLALSLVATTGCRRESTTGVTIALSEKFSGLATLSNAEADAAADRIRNLIFNSLVKKNEKFEYVGELAKDINIGDDGLTITFTLQDGVRFHNGQVLSSADVKYTLDSLFASDTSMKAGSFFDSTPDPSDPEKKRKLKTPHISSLETPDAKTVVLRVGRPALVNQTLSNLVTIPIIPSGTFDAQRTAPIGSGPFKFTSFDQVNSQVNLEAYSEYWEGAPKIQTLTVKTVPDANALQAELQSGGVDVSPLPTNLSPDTIRTLGQMPNLKVDEFSGSNIQYLGFNTESAPFDSVKVRQAVAHAIDREGMIRDLLAGMAKPADSILPVDSWAYAKGAQYPYDPEKAKQLLTESGYQGQLVKFKFSAGTAAVRDYAQVIQDSLTKIGMNVEIETVDFNTLITQLGQGQFQMTTARWVGGNQDPIFLRDLFSSAYFPDKRVGGRNRSRYTNTEFDRIIEEAVNTTDKTKAKELYARAQQIVADELPLLPLWYPSNIVITTRRIGNVKINASGDWSFVKDLTVQ